VGTLLVVICCFFGSRGQHDAPSALRGLFFHSRHVAWWCIQRLPPLLLPFSCRVHCPYLLLCFLYHGRFSRHCPCSLGIRSRSAYWDLVTNPCPVLLLSIVQSAYCRLLASVFVGGLVKIHSCGAAVDRSVVQSARRRLLAYWTFSLLLYWRLTPVVHIAGSTGLSVLLIHSMCRYQPGFRFPS
jgi:hypothetical protein